MSEKIIYQESRIDIDEPIREELVIYARPGDFINFRFGIASSKRELIEGDLVITNPFGGKVIVKNYALLAIDSMDDSLKIGIDGVEYDFDKIVDQLRPLFYSENLNDLIITHELNTADSILNEGEELASSEVVYSKDEDLEKNIGSVPSEVTVPSELSTVALSTYPILTFFPPNVARYDIDVLYTRYGTTFESQSLTGTKEVVTTVRRSNITPLYGSSYDSDPLKSQEIDMEVINLNTGGGLSGQDGFAQYMYTSELVDFGDRKGPVYLTAPTDSEILRSIGISLNSRFIVINSLIIENMPEGVTFVSNNFAEVTDFGGGAFGISSKVQSARLDLQIRYDAGLPDVQQAIRYHLEAYDFKNNKLVRSENGLVLDFKNVLTSGVSGILNFQKAQYATFSTAIDPLEIKLTQFDDIVFGNYTDHIYHLGAGDDQFYSGSGNHTVYMDLGAGTYYILQGNDKVYTDGENSVIKFQVDAMDSLYETLSSLQLNIWGNSSGKGMVNVVNPNSGTQLNSEFTGFSSIDFGEAVVEGIHINIVGTNGFAADFEVFNVKDAIVFLNKVTEVDGYIIDFSDSTSLILQGYNSTSTHDAIVFQENGVAAVYGSAGSDRFISGVGNYYFDGRGGNNSISYSGIDTITYIIFNASDNKVNKLGQRETVDIIQNINTIYGTGNDNDLFNASFSNNMIYHGKEGATSSSGKVSYLGVGEENQVGITVDYTRHDTIVYVDKSDGNNEDQLHNIATLEGSKGDDTYIFKYDQSYNIEGALGNNTADYSQIMVNNPISVQIQSSGFINVDKGNNTDRFGENVITTIIGNGGDNYYTVRDSSRSYTIKDSNAFFDYLELNLLNFIVQQDKIQVNKESLGTDTINGSLNSFTGSNDDNTLTVHSWGNLSSWVEQIDLKDSDFSDSEPDQQGNILQFEDAGLKKLSLKSPDSQRLLNIDTLILGSNTNLEELSYEASIFKRIVNNAGEGLQIKLGAISTQGSTASLQSLTISSANVKIDYDSDAASVHLFNLFYFIIGAASSSFTVKMEDETKAYVVEKEEDLLSPIYVHLDYSSFTTGISFNEQDSQVTKKEEEGVVDDFNELMVQGIMGGSGNDLFEISLTSVIKIDGKEGNNTVSWAQSLAAFQGSLSASSHYKNIQNLKLTNKDDTLTVTAEYITELTHEQNIDGLDGNDFLRVSSIDFGSVSLTDKGLEFISSNNNNLFFKNFNIVELSFVDTYTGNFTFNITGGWDATAYNVMSDQGNNILAVDDSSTDSQYVIKLYEHSRTNTSFDTILNNQEDQAVLSIEQWNSDEKQVFTNLNQVDMENVIGDVDLHIQLNSILFASDWARDIEFSFSDQSNVNMILEGLMASVTATISYNNGYNIDLDIPNNVGDTLSYSMESLSGLSSIQPEVTFVLESSVESLSASIELTGSPISSDNKIELSGDFSNTIDIDLKTQDSQLSIENFVANLSNIHHIDGGSNRLNVTIDFLNNDTQYKIKGTDSLVTYKNVDYLAQHIINDGDGIHTLVTKDLQGINKDDLQGFYRYKNEIDSNLNDGRDKYSIFLEAKLEHELHITSTADTQASIDQQVLLQDLGIDEVKTIVVDITSTTFDMSFQDNNRELVGKGILVTNISRLVIDNSITQETQFQVNELITNDITLVASSGHKTNKLHIANNNDEEDYKISINLQNSSVGYSQNDETKGTMYLQNMNEINIAGNIHVSVSISILQTGITITSINVSDVSDDYNKIIDYSESRSAVSINLSLLGQDNNDGISLIGFVDYQLTRYDDTIILNQGDGISEDVRVFGGGGINTLDLKSINNNQASSLTISLDGTSIGAQIGNWGTQGNYTGTFDNFTNFVFSSEYEQGVEIQSLHNSISGSMLNLQFSISEDNQTSDNEYEYNITDAVGDDTTYYLNMSFGNGNFSLIKYSINGDLYDLLGIDSIQEGSGHIIFNISHTSAAIFNMSGVTQSYDFTTNFLRPLGSDGSVNQTFNFSGVTAESQLKLEMEGVHLKITSNVNNTIGTITVQNLSSQALILHLPTSVVNTLALQSFVSSANISASSHTTLHLHATAAVKSINFASDILTDSSDNTMTITGLQQVLAAGISYDGNILFQGLNAYNTFTINVFAWSSDIYTRGINYSAMVSAVKFNFSEDSVSIDKGNGVVDNIAGMNSYAGSQVNDTFTISDDFSNTASNFTISGGGGSGNELDITQSITLGVGGEITWNSGVNKIKVENIQIFKATGVALVDENALNYWTNQGHLYFSSSDSNGNFNGGLNLSHLNDYSMLISQIDPGIYNLSVYNSIHSSLTFAVNNQVESTINAPSIETIHIDMRAYNTNFPKIDISAQQVENIEFIPHSGNWTYGYSLINYKVLKIDSTGVSINNELFLKNNQGSSIQIESIQVTNDGVLFIDGDFSIMPKESFAKYVVLSTDQAKVTGLNKVSVFSNNEEKHIQSDRYFYLDVDLLDMSGMAAGSATYMFRDTTGDQIETLSKKDAILDNTDGNMHLSFSLNLSNAAHIVQLIIGRNAYYTFKELHLSETHSSDVNFFARSFNNIYVVKLLYSDQWNTETNESMISRLKITDLSADFGGVIKDSYIFHISQDSSFSFEAKANNNNPQIITGKNIRQLDFGHSNFAEGGFNVTVNIDLGGISSSAFSKGAQSLYYVKGFSEGADSFNKTEVNFTHLSVSVNTIDISVFIPDMSRSSFRINGTFAQQDESEDGQYSFIGEQLTHLKFSAVIVNNVPQNLNIRFANMSSTYFNNWTTISLNVTSHPSGTITSPFVTTDTQAVYVMQAANFNIAKLDLKGIDYSSDDVAMNMVFVNGYWGIFKEASIQGSDTYYLDTMNASSVGALFDLGQVEKYEMSGTGSAQFIYSEANNQVEQFGSLSPVARGTVLRASFSSQEGTLNFSEEEGQPLITISIDNKNIKLQNISILDLSASLRTINLDLANVTGLLINASYNFENGVQTGVLDQKISEQGRDISDGQTIELSKGGSEDNSAIVISSGVWLNPLLPKEGNIQNFKITHTLKYDDDNKIVLDKLSSSKGITIEDVNYGDLFAANAQINSTDQLEVYLNAAVAGAFITNMSGTFTDNSNLSDLLVFTGGDYLFNNNNNNRLHVTSGRHHAVDIHGIKYLVGSSLFTGALDDAQTYNINQINASTNVQNNTYIFDSLYRSEVHKIQSDPSLVIALKLEQASGSTEQGYWQVGMSLQVGSGYGEYLAHVDHMMDNTSINQFNHIEVQDNERGGSSTTPLGIAVAVYVDQAADYNIVDLGYRPYSSLELQGKLVTQSELGAFILSGEAAQYFLSDQLISSNVDANQAVFQYNNLVYYDKLHEHENLSIALFTPVDGKSHFMIEGMSASFSGNNRINANFIGATYLAFQQKDVNDNWSITLKLFAYTDTSYDNEVFIIDLRQNFTDFNQSNGNFYNLNIEYSALRIESNKLENGIYLYEVSYDLSGENITYHVYVLGADEAVDINRSKYLEEGSLLAISLEYDNWDEFLEAMGYVNDRNETIIEAEQALDMASVEQDSLVEVSLNEEDLAEDLLAEGLLEANNESIIYNELSGLLLEENESILLTDNLVEEASFEVENLDLSQNYHDIFVDSAVEVELVNDISMIDQNDEAGIMNTLGEFDMVDMMSSMLQNAQDNEGVMGDNNDQSAVNEVLDMIDELSIEATYEEDETASMSFALDQNMMWEDGLNALSSIDSRKDKNDDTHGNA